MDRGRARRRRCGPLLLITGAQATGIGRPEPLVEALAAHHRVTRDDRRDTGRSTWPFEEQSRTGSPISPMT
ncbi:hypothetical protein [Streptomyces sp. NPDC048516]|uniref:hypothetical protein n=1 Tax=Streptomyces sp. NPDC048516 TaxID=3365565 RepID=UPI00371B044B